MQLCVEEVDWDGWGKEVEGFFTMPFVYEISGAHNKLFLDYYKRRILEKPEHIIINVETFTYKDSYSTYKLNSKKWTEELSHKNYLTQYGITTFVKYSSS